MSLSRDLAKDRDLAVSPQFGLFCRQFKRSQKILEIVVQFILGTNFLLSSED